MKNNLARLVPALKRELARPRCGGDAGSGREIEGEQAGCTTQVIEDGHIITGLIRSSAGPTLPALIGWTWQMPRSTREWLDS